MNVIRLYYGFTFFFNLLFWLPTFYEYQRQMGLDDGAIFRIQSIYYLAFCLLEIPTGFIADRWSYRRCLWVGSAVLFASNLLASVAPTYLGFLWQFLLLALARSLISGASNAYMYEYMSRRGKAALFKDVEGKARAYSLVGRILCWSALGLIPQGGFALAYWLTAVSSLAAIVTAWKLPELPRVTKASGFSVAELFPAFEVLRRTPYLVLVILQGVGIFVLCRVCQVNLFQPILAAKGFDVASFGLLFSLTMAFEAVGSAYPALMRRWMTDLNSVFALTIALAATLAFVPYSGSVWTIVWLCAFSLIAGVAYPIQRQVLNDAIPEERFRATLLSVESLAGRGASAWAASVIGVYMADGRMDDFLILSAAVTTAGIFALIAAFSTLTRFFPVRSDLP